MVFPDRSVSVSDTGRTARLSFLTRRKATSESFWVSSTVSFQPSLAFCRPDEVGTDIFIATLKSKLSSWPCSLTWELSLSELPLERPRTPERPSPRLSRRPSYVCSSFNRAARYDGVSDYLASSNQWRILFFYIIGVLIVGMIVDSKSPLLAQAAKKGTAGGASASPFVVASKSSAETSSMRDSRLIALPPDSHLCRNQGSSLLDQRVHLDLYLLGRQLGPVHCFPNLVRYGS